MVRNQAPGYNGYQVVPSQSRVTSSSRTTYNPRNNQVQTVNQRAYESVNQRAYETVSQRTYVTPSHKTTETVSFRTYETVSRATYETVSRTTQPRGGNGRRGGNQIQW